MNVKRKNEYWKSSYKNIWTKVRSPCFHNSKIKNVPIEPLQEAKRYYCSLCEASQSYAQEQKMKEHLLMMHNDALGLRELTKEEKKAFRIKQMDKDYQKKYRVIEWNDFYNGNLPKIS